MRSHPLLTILKTVRKIRKGLNQNEYKQNFSRFVKQRLHAVHGTLELRWYNILIVDARPVQVCMSLKVWINMLLWSSTLFCTFNFHPQSKLLFVLRSVCYDCIPFVAFYPDRSEKIVRKFRTSEKNLTLKNNPKTGVIKLTPEWIWFPSKWLYK